MSRDDWNRPAPDSVGPNPGFHRIAMEISYDGRGFCGWQTQKGQRTVQEELQSVISGFLGFSITLFGSGRTDSGVHAMGQVCHFDVPNSCTIPSKAFSFMQGIPSDIQIRRCWDAPKLFHSRFSSMAREYRYFIRSSDDFTCFENGLAGKVRKLPPVSLMNSYAEVLRGTHDFSTFSGSGDLSQSKFRDIYESEFQMMDSPYGGEVLVYRICGNAFLYHMVRSLVGTMLTLAKTMAPKERMIEILECKDRSQALTTAKPDGLYLWRISFDPNEYQWFEEKTDEIN